MGSTYDEEKKEKEAIAQHNNELKAQNVEKEKAIATDKAKIRELQSTNKQLPEFLHTATKRTTDAEEQARVHAAHVHSRSGSTGVFTTGSDIPDPALQNELNQV